VDSPPRSPSIGLRGERAVAKWGARASETFLTAVPYKTPTRGKEKPRRRKTAHSPSRATMSTHSDLWVSDTSRPTFDPNIDIATVVFSHVRCVKTRGNLALVSKLWRDASKPAAAYPLRFDFGAFPNKDSWMRTLDHLRMMDNDEALSLPYERVVGLLGEAANYGNCELCYSSYAASRGSVRLLKWMRVNNRAWSAGTCSFAARYGHLPALQYLHENGCPWDQLTCLNAAYYKRWDCFQYAVDNKCPGWEKYAEEYAEHLR
jgi:hypothetical protein